MKKKKYDEISITDEQSEAIALCLLPVIQQFFESEEGQREFDIWKKQQAKTESEE